MDNNFAKFLMFVLLMLIAPVLTGIYGAIHDQLTYTISPEFFTKFRFPNVFGPMDEKWHDPAYSRLGAAIVGWRYSWKLGVIGGAVLSLVGLIHSNPGKMLSNTIKAYFIALIVSFLVGVIGLSTGIFNSLNDKRVHLPDGIEDSASFIAVETMHNFSYMGGIIGTLVGVWWQIYKRRKEENLLSKTHQPGEM